jgi:5,10-methylenetetrahydromethanopterin reductase
MRIGILEYDVRTAGPAIEGARKAEAAGFDCYWLAGGWRDPITLQAIVGTHVPRISLATGVASVWQTHPLAAAEQALTVNDAVGGRFVLGLGLAHFHMVETRMGRKFERPIRMLREYLTILMTAMDTGKVDFKGEMLSAHTDLRLPKIPRPKVLIAALGPQSVKVTGTWADGTVTFMVSKQSLETMTVPTASAAAKEAGRPRPYFVAQAPICITNDVDRVKAEVAKTFIQYGNGFYPSYQNALHRDGLSGPAEIAVVGDETAVLAELCRYRDIGMDEFMGVVLCGTDEEKARTKAFLAAQSERNSRRT